MWITGLIAMGEGEEITWQPEAHSSDFPFHKSPQEAGLFLRFPLAGLFLTLLLYATLPQELGFLFNQAVQFIGPQNIFIPKLKSPSIKVKTKFWHGPFFRKQPCANQGGDARSGTPSWVPPGTSHSQVVLFVCLFVDLLASISSSEKSG